MCDRDAGEEIQNILLKIKDELKSVEVHKEIPLEFDLGNLLSSDRSTLDEKLLKSADDAENYLCTLARDAVQALLNKVWDLPSQRIDNIIYATLPKPVTILPREKPLPKGKFVTKWEQYARDKGMQRRKKTKKLWDETLKRWVPRYGMKKAQAEREKTWMVEVPGNADPYEDQLAKGVEAKKERVAKNEYQRLRNIAKARKVKVPSTGVTGSEFANKDDISKAMHHSRQSTASLGRFQQKLPDEKPLKGLGKKRKPELENPDDSVGEKRRALDVIDRMNRPQLKLEGAVGKQLRTENAELSQKKKKGSMGDKRRSKLGGRQRTKSDQRSVVLGKGLSKGKGRGGKNKKIKADGGKGAGKWSQSVMFSKGRGGKKSGNSKGKGGGGGKKSIKGKGKN